MRKIKSAIPTRFESACPPLVEAKNLYRMLAHGETLSGLRKLIGDGQDDSYRWAVRKHFEDLVAKQRPQTPQVVTTSSTNEPKAEAENRAPRREVKTHGTRHGYNCGCRCPSCYASNARYRQERRKRETDAQRDSQVELQVVAG